jgi:CBS-domain-containing membrane protein
MKHRLRRFPGKLRAPLSPASRPPRGWKHTLWSFVAGAAGILAVTGVSAGIGHELLIGPFGASAVLLYGAHESPFSQPRNVLGGHVLSALVGCALHAAGFSGPLALAAAVGLSIVVMHLTHTVHPPGGATALIALHDQAGWLFPLLPVLAGAAILVLIAVFTNNIVHHRQYPKHWW